MEQNGWDFVEYHSTANLELIHVLSLRSYWMRLPNIKYLVKSGSMLITEEDRLWAENEGQRTGIKNGNPIHINPIKVGGSDQR